MKRLLLISSSTVHGHGYLQYCADDLLDFLGEAVNIIFIPYALHDQAAYAEKVRRRFIELGLDLKSVHDMDDPRAGIAEADAIFVGGGNTFRLLKGLYEHGLLEAIRRRVKAGMPYVGSSAGTNVACPTIRTTNDMPIVWLPSLDALGLISFQINPHYVDADPASTHMGETREQRLIEYLEENPTPVLGLREGAHLRIEGDDIAVRGASGARLFRRRHEPLEIAPGDRLEDLLK